MTTDVPAGASPGGTSSTVAPSAVPPRLSWHRCDAHYLCSGLSVPVDYADPTGAHLRLALAELPATSTHVIGDLVMNPGGPGASGVQFLETTSFPAALRSSFNLVGFDPRGTGQSDPVSCEDATGIRGMIALDPDPQTPLRSPPSCGPSRPLTSPAPSTPPCRCSKTWAHATR